MGKMAVRERGGASNARRVGRGVSESRGVERSEGEGGTSGRAETAAGNAPVVGAEV